MIYLSGCGRLPVVLPDMPDQERCAIRLEYNDCRCHIYRVSPEMVGRVSESTNKPIEYCDKLIGFSVDDIVERVLWYEEVFETIKDANSQSKNPVALMRPRFETEVEIKELVK